jgi:Flp pilus assembly protein TadD
MTAYYLLSDRRRAMTRLSGEKPVLLLSLISLFVIIAPAVCLANAADIFYENSKAVVVVVAYDELGKPISQGSGFIVRQDGVIVTNHHVISRARKIKIKAADKIFDVRGLIDLDKDNDIAILKVDGEDMQTVSLGDMRRTGIGEKVYVISSPKGLENTISDGLLSGRREKAPKKIVLQITAPISPGSSGGPVFNKKGEVIGIATFVLRDSQNLNFAMPIDSVKNKIRDFDASKIKEVRIEDYQKTAEYWFNLGYAYSSAGKKTEAIKAYREAISIKPNLVNAHYNLGNVYGRLGRNEEAIESYKQALRIRPTYAEAHNNLGNIYINLRQYKEAAESCKQAIRLKPDFTEAHNNLGLTYANLGDNQKAVECYKQAIRIKPGYSIAHYNLGRSYLALKDTSAALDQYKILQKLDKVRADRLFKQIYK